MNSYTVRNYGERQAFTAIEPNDKDWQLNGNYVTRLSLINEYFDFELDLKVPLDQIPLGSWMNVWVSMEDMNIDYTGARTHKWESFSVAIKYDGTQYDPYENGGYGEEIPESNVRFSEYWGFDQIKTQCWAEMGTKIPNPAVDYKTLE